MQERQVTWMDNRIHCRSFMVWRPKPHRTGRDLSTAEAQSDRFLLKVRIDATREDRPKSSVVLPSAVPVSMVLRLPKSWRRLRSWPRFGWNVWSRSTSWIWSVPHRVDNQIADLARIIKVGASPRATIALAITARAYAFLVGGRGYVAR